MAELTNSILGNLSGNLGDLIFKKYKNKVVVCSKPSKYKTSQSEIAKFSRNRFLSLSKFSSFLNKRMKIKSIWDKLNHQGSTAYKKILIYNSPFLADEFISANNCILPFNCKNLLNSFQFHSNQLVLKFEDYDNLLKYEFVELYVVFQKHNASSNHSIELRLYSQQLTKTKDSIQIEINEDYLNLKKTYGELIIFPIFIKEDEYLSFKGTKLI